MNRKSSCVLGDLPIQIIYELSNFLTLLLTPIINIMFEQGRYPELWKKEVITPAPKVYPTLNVKQLRPISGLINFAKITDRILAEYMTSDMSTNRDRHQYGNEKGISVNHYLINLIHKVLTFVDKNSASEKFTAVLMMLDWSQAFERQSHILGVQSFIDNGVRASLIPLLCSFFKNRQIVVKWNKEVSTP